MLRAGTNVWGGHSEDVSDNPGWGFEHQVQASCLSGRAKKALGAEVGSAERRNHRPGVGWQEGQWLKRPGLAGLCHNGYSSLHLGHSEDQRTRERLPGRRGDVRCGLLRLQGERPVNGGVCVICVACLCICIWYVLLCAVYLWYMCAVVCAICICCVHAMCVVCVWYVL